MLYPYVPGKSCPFLSLLGDLEAVGILVVELMSRCSGGFSAVLLEYCFAV